MNLTAILKQETAAFYELLKARNRFYLAIFNGEVHPDGVAYFLENVRFLVAHTPKHLLLAIEVSESRGFHDLAEFFRQKLAEETGHDQWAEADLRNLSKVHSQVKKQHTIAPAITKLVLENEQIIRRDPHLYLVHIFFAEYFTVLDGPEFMEALSRIGIPKTMLSVVDNHVQLDIGHVEEWEQIIEGLIDDVKYRDVFLRQLRNSFETYEQFLGDLERYDYTG